jgi:hypothetical protein
MLFSQLSYFFFGHALSLSALSTPLRAHKLRNEVVSESRSVPRHPRSLLLDLDTKAFQEVSTQFRAILDG